MLYDVLVVGGGNAGLCAALSARERGATVILLESAPKEWRGGNTSFGGGGIRVVHNGVQDIKSFVPNLTAAEIAISDFGAYSKEQYLSDLYRITENRIDSKLAELIVGCSTATVRWMSSYGVPFAPQYELNAYKHAGRYVFPTGYVIAVPGGGRALVDAQFAAAERLGIKIRYHARAFSLVHGRNGVTGVRVVDGGIEEVVSARAVVLACGGFEANPEWRARYLGPGWDLAKVRGTPYNTGDGIQMALEVGAQRYGQWSGAHTCAWDINAPDYGDRTIADGYSRHDYPKGILLNADGYRFLDEGADDYNYTYAKYGRIVLAQPGQRAWQIFDGKVSPLLNQHYRMEKTTKYTADTLAEMIDKLDGIDKRQALKTISDFNAAVEQEIPFNPNVKDGRNTRRLPVPKSNWANTIDSPPFEAYPVTGGITFTFGGVKITSAGEVVDLHDEPIPGLFAAGEMVGGIFYFNYPGGTGFMSGAVIGRIAGKSAARHR